MADQVEKAVKSAGSFVTEDSLRRLTAWAVASTRRLREASGSEIIPGDASSKLGWFRDDSVGGLVRPVIQTRDTDCAPVLMWARRGSGGNRYSSIDGNIISVEAHIRDCLPVELADMGYRDYPRSPGHRSDDVPTDVSITRTDWERAHPGVVEEAKARILRRVLDSEDARGHIVLASEPSFLNDFGDDIAFFVDVPLDTAVARNTRRRSRSASSGDMEQHRKAAYSDEKALSDVLSALKAKYPKRFYETGDLMENFVASEGFERALQDAEVPLMVVDTGVLGTGGLFLSGTSGGLEYAKSRTAFNARYDYRELKDATRTFVDADDLLSRGSVTLHDSDAGTGYLKGRINSVTSGRMRDYYRHSIHSSDRNYRTDNQSLAGLATLRESDAPEIIRNIAGADAPPANAEVPVMDAGGDRTKIINTSVAKSGPNIFVPKKLIGDVVSTRHFISKSPRRYYVDRLDDPDAYGAFVNAAGGASPLTRFKAMIAVRTLADVARSLGDNGGGPLSYPTAPDGSYDTGCRRTKNLPTSEFKTRSLTGRDWNESVRKILVPDRFIGTEKHKYAARKYPHIEFVPFSTDDSNVREEFSEKSGKLMLETRKDDKGGESL